MNRKSLNFIFFIFLVSGCSLTSYQPGIVESSDAGKIQSVLLGTLLKIDEVVIEGNRDLGATAGATVGADLGSDNDKAPVAAGVIGALIGSAIGSEVGANINKVNALELTIELDSGRLISIVQEASREFALIEGQRVKITKTSNRSRVSPF